MSDRIQEAIPENAPVPVHELILKTGGSVPEPFLRDTDLIQSKWQERVRANPHLFNGKVFLQSGLALEKDRMTGSAVELDYASFMHWRGNAPFQSETGLYHVFPLAAIESKEGHLIAVRSASTTVNSGLVYFAAGMFDDHDVVGGRLDPVGNMKREVEEETGLDLDAMKADGASIAFRTARFVAVFQRYVAAMDSQSIIAAIMRHALAQQHPEIDNAIAIKGQEGVSQNMPGYMQAYCRWRLER
ncbi:MAG: hypothetical protein ACRCU5_02450 [Rhizobiaceae bacterium]